MSWHMSLAHAIILHFRKLSGSCNKKSLDVPWGRFRKLDLAHEMTMFFWEGFRKLDRAFGERFRKLELAHGLAMCFEKGSTNFASDKIRKLCKWQESQTLQVTIFANLQMTRVANFAIGKSRKRHESHKRCKWQGSQTSLVDNWTHSTMCV